MRAVIPDGQRILPARLPARGEFDASAGDAERTASAALKHGLCAERERSRRIF